MLPGGKEAVPVPLLTAKSVSTNGFLSFSEFMYSFKNDLPTFGLLVGSFLFSFGWMDQQS